jgi:hypothetical protein
VIEKTEDYQSQNLTINAAQSNGAITIHGTDAGVLYRAMQINAYEVAGDGKTFEKGFNKDGYQMECFERRPIGHGTTEYTCQVGLDIVNGSVAGWGNSADTTHWYSIFNNPWSAAAGKPITQLYRGENLTIAPVSKDGTLQASIALLNEDAHQLYYAMKNVAEKDQAGVLVKDSGTVKCMKEKKSAKSAKSDVAYSCLILVDYANGNLLNTQVQVVQELVQL